MQDSQSSIESSITNYELKNLSYSKIKIKPSTATARFKKWHFWLPPACLVGRGTPADHKTGIKWINVATLSGIVDAQWMVAGLYGAGKGVEFDPIMSYVWTSISAANRNVDS